ncbi:hypothetical protein [Nocardioides daphniae]|uniref:DUF4352 domain-containing protein n=1 Tax=Nocardioides daphniae TaxID=402297 RepID=A0A4P7UDT4_9ACTN|nr:hypothetical protein [Nocardioides daphniae]QCC77089.1 hypothetical protein E2C04_07460 [Nocardioides daphniae]GGD19500.1 hypothetical protein GCM10007231_18320 [Nocardioides daphniae]
MTGDEREGAPGAEAGPADEEAAPAPRGRRFATLARTVSLRQAAIGVATVVVLASGAFGGLATAQKPPAHDDLSPGEQVSVGPFDLTVHRARWVSDLGPGFDAPEGRYVALVVTLENTSDHPVAMDDVERVITATDLPGTYDEFGRPADDGEVAPPQVVVLADATRLSQAQPGLAYEAAFLWDQSGDVEAPTELSFSLVALERRGSTLDDTMVWADPTVTHTATFDVEADPKAGS